MTSRNLTTDFASSAAAESGSRSHFLVTIAVLHVKGGLSNNNNNNNSLGSNIDFNEEDGECHYSFTENLDVRFPLIVLFMGSMCLIGVLGNSASIYILTKKRMQTTSNWFLVLLAACDLGVLSSSLLIYVVEVAYDYLESFVLYRLWFSYIKEVYVLGHICQGAAVYSTVAATVERWVVLGFSKSCQKSVCQGRNMIVSTVLLMIVVIVAQLPRYFEVQIQTMQNCRTFGRYALAPSQLLENEIYVSVYSIWISNLVFVFLPFTVLLILNIVIFHKITRREPERRGTMFASPFVKRIEERIHKRKTKEATVVLLIVVAVFLICNVPAVILSILEQAGAEFLHTHPSFYSFSRDIVNLLAAVNSSANFAVYVIFGKDFRKELVKIPLELQAVFCKVKRRHQGDFLTFRRRNVRRLNKTAADGSPSAEKDLSHNGGDESTPRTQREQLEMTPSIGEVHHSRLRADSASSSGSTNSAGSLDIFDLSNYSATNGRLIMLLRNNHALCSSDNEAEDDERPNNSDTEDQAKKHRPST